MRQRELFKICLSTLFRPGSLADSDDLDEMPHVVAFHQGLHCLLRKKRCLERQIIHF